MATSTNSANESLLALRKHPVGYVAAILAVVTGVLHLVIVGQAPNQTLQALFALNGLGFLAGTALYLTRYWQREFYVVAAVYALVTILALFPFQGYGIEAFYVDGALNPMRVVTKGAEAGLVVAAAYLYVATGDS
ncbi:hypothetical protein OB905_10120 [Halobacteria archaeon AArc-dxtr1]|nr:hypothetical protein [Halobacteria archaeon AArc-dxtr1]